MHWLLEDCFHMNNSCWKDKNPVHRTCASHVGVSLSHARVKGAAGLHALMH
jgi:hypothetical protein